MRCADVIGKDGSSFKWAIRQRHKSHLQTKIYTTEKTEAYKITPKQPWFYWNRNDVALLSAMLCIFIPLLNLWSTWYRIYLASELSVFEQFKQVRQKHPPRNALWNVWFKRGGWNKFRVRRGNQALVYPSAALCSNPVSQRQHSNTQ